MVLFVRVFIKSAFLSLVTSKLTICRSFYWIQLINGLRSIWPLSESQWKALEFIRRCAFVINLQKLCESVPPRIAFVRLFMRRFLLLFFLTVSNLNFLLTVSTWSRPLLFTDLLPVASEQPGRSGMKPGQHKLCELVILFSRWPVARGRISICYTRDTSMRCGFQFFTMKHGLHCSKLHFGFKR